VLAREATGLRARGDERVVALSGGIEVTARAVVLATGVDWRRLAVPALEALQGAGVFYGAAASEAAALEGRRVFVVGAGNSAGQAAVHLARHAASVTVLVRRERLGATMSDYLVRELEQTPNIAIRLQTEVVDGRGTGCLTRLTLRDRATGAVDEVEAAALFVMIGAEPRTQWLGDSVVRDAQGYVLTGHDLLEGGRAPAGWPLERPPLYLESSMPGVFAAGDVRARSVKRVAAAAGSGSIAIQLVHRHLADLDDARAGVRRR
jgi:thioredoxin reductase (NADPH)